MIMNYYVSAEKLNGKPCNGIVHVIKKGDTLYKLSRIYDVKIADLIWKNPGVRIYNLQIGDKLCIPVQQNSGMGNENGEIEASPETFPYVVREGENLEEILAMFHLTYDDLKKLNPDAMAVYPAGTVLNIPSDRILRQSL
jgi:LysM repeat protein